MDIRPLNVEIEKFKEFINKFHLLFERENFSYNLLESQFEQLRMRNAKLNEENLAIEKRIKDSLDASEKILQEARKQETEIKTASMVLYQKAQSKYRQIEESLTKGEKKQIEGHLKELEAMVA